ncbi:MAG: 4Fe-4S dicluster domain-containing protein [Nanoarchaeota archaeon]|nr:4Fe-4S dicluster domain-containing protein [Nanoarchaeota archaeon]
MQKVLKKRDLNSFLTKLKKNYEIIAPVKKDVVKYEKIENFDDIYLKEIPLFSPKKFFLPVKEVILEHNKGNVKTPNFNIKPRIIFGIRKCDLNALLRLDKLYFGDSFYEEKRENTILIGYHCDKPNEYCFCNSMVLTDHYDLNFYNGINKFLIDVKTKKGENLVKDLKNIKFRKRKIKNFRKLEKKDLHKYFNNEIWDEIVKDCLSCGACTNLCPTCCCFDVKEEIDISLDKGKRVRVWDSCQLKDFTRVAGDHVFRESRKSRYRHFVYHKLQYFKDEFSEYMCTGCGRCTRGCPTRVDFVKAVNKLK